jgi:uncharacterized membrane protein YbhN (UPF0104 family)
MKIIKNILKLVVGVGLIYWLYSKGSFKSEHLINAINNPLSFLLAFFLLCSQIIIASWRWNKILSFRMKSMLSFSKALGITWIGIFFSTVLPGAVTGDIIKINYIKQDDHNVSKRYMYFSILFDRIIGLSGLVGLAFFISIFNYKFLSSLSPNTKKILYINGILFLGIVAFFLMNFLPEKFQSKMDILLFKIPKVGKSLSDLIHQFWSLSNRKDTILKLIFVSMFGHILNIFAFWTLITAIQPESTLSFAQITSIAPIGFLAIAIPISPAGLGVGHIAFENLFLLIGIKNGASLFNIFWITSVLTNLFGMLPFFIGVNRVEKK